MSMIGPEIRICEVKFYHDIGYIAKERGHIRI